MYEGTYRIAGLDIAVSSMYRRVHEMCAEYRADGTPTGHFGKKANGSAMLRCRDGRHNYFENAEGDYVQAVYGRVFIRRK